tara:strand:+ start:329 stop:1711 length:1383 start_codon:yes stop_codon:yes gene_type:complete
MAYKQIFGRENVGGTGASFSNTDLTNPVKKKPVKVKEESVTPVQTITKNSKEFFKPSYKENYEAGNVESVATQDLYGNEIEPTITMGLDEVVLSNKKQNPVVGPKTQEQATDYGADTSYKYAPRFNRTEFTKEQAKKHQARRQGAFDYGYKDPGPFISHEDIPGMKLTRYFDSWTKSKNDYIQNTRNQHLKPEFQSYPSMFNNFKSQEIDVSQGQSQVDFQSLVQDPAGQTFLNRYNDPVTRKLLREQSGLSNMDIDNMIIKALQATTTHENEEVTKKMKAGGYHAQAYSNTPRSIHQEQKPQDLTGKIQMGKDVGEPVHNHEYSHISGFDVTQGKYLKKLVGSAYNQRKNNPEWLETPQKSIFHPVNNPDTTEYMNRDHELYGNFVEFREELGLKPGEQIDMETLKRMVEEKNLYSDHFYKFVAPKNALNALNKVGSVNKNEQIPFSQRFKRNRDSALS